MARKPEKDFLKYRSQGDGRALARVFDSLAPRLLLLAAHVVRDHAQAEDLVQETFLRAMISTESYDKSRPLFPWLVGILHNEARKARRTTSRSPDPERLARTASDLGEQVESRELLDRLSDQLASLPETYRDVLNLRLIHGLQPVEIAHSLGRPPSTVSTQLQRGLALLRRTLPAGFTVLLAASTGRGLDAVRRTVLVGIHGAAPAATATVLFGGCIMLMKKAFLGVALMVAVALIWLFLPGILETPAVPGRVPIQEQGDPVSAALETIDAPRETPAQRQALAPDIVEEASLVVRVRWAQGGAPAPGVAVRVDPQNGKDPRLHGREGATGSDGTVRFDSIAPGRARISLDRGVQAECDVVSGRQATVDLLVPLGVDVEGRVVDETGQPVAGAEVWVDPPNRYSESVPAMMFPTTVSDHYGKFAIPHVSSRSGVGARASDLGHSRILSIPSGAGSGEPVDLTLVIEGPGVDVRGRVVDARGGPIVSALVAFGEREIVNPARLPDGTWATFWQCFYLRTDVQGRFVARGLVPRKVWVRAESSGYAPYEQRVEPSAASELVIVLKEGGRVFGTVSDTDGRPIAGATVLPSRRQIDLMTIGERMRTDSRGRFELDSLPSGTVKLLAHADGHERSKVEVALGAGTSEEWNPTLTPLPVIHGTILDEGGQPLAQARVLAEVEPKTRGIPATIDSVHDAAVGSTNASGRFSIAVGIGKQYGLTLTERGALIGVSLTEEPVSGSGEELVFTVPDAQRATAWIEGRLLNGAGEPLEGAGLQLGHNDTLRGIGRSELTSGTFSIGPLPPGRYEVHASPSDPDEAAVALGPFDVYPNQVLDLGDVSPGPSGDLLFSYVCRDGSRIEMISVDLESLDGKIAELLVVDPDRESRSRLPAGEYRLTVWGTGIVSVVDYAVTVREGETTRVALELEPGVRRELRFPTPIPDDWPAEGHAQVILRMAGAVEPLRDSRITVRRPMRYAPSLGLGDYVLVLILDDGRRFSGSFSIEDLKADQVPLQVRMSAARREHRF